MARYTADDIRVIEGGPSWVRDHPDMFFGGMAMSRARVLAWVVACDCLAVRSGAVSVVEQGEWWFVCCDTDWLKGVKGEPPKRTEIGVESLFERLVAAPEAGVNSCRAEVLVNAFAAAVVTGTPGSLVLISGTENDKQAVASLVSALACPAEWRRFVAFRMEQAKVASSEEKDPSSSMARF